MSGQDTKRSIRRRRVLKSLGTTTLLGIGGAGTASAGKGGPPDDRGRPANRGPPDREGEERTIEWDGQGSEHATQDCPRQNGFWHWVLTPGGQPAFSDVGKLAVTFEDDTTVEASSYQPGQSNGKGAYHFDIYKAGGGTVDEASVDVEGGGKNALLTISDGSCEDTDATFWQIDFGTGTEPPEPPRYGESGHDLILAAVGSSEGVTCNPSFEDDNHGVTVTDWEFDFDDDASPTEVTVEFEVEDGEKDLHLAVFERPPLFLDSDDVDEDCTLGEDDNDLLGIDEQELYENSGGSFDGEDSITINIPTPSSS